MSVTYIVSGFARSGTSMMMRALYEGMGRKVPMVVDESRLEKLNSGEHIPNHEYLEPPLKAFTSPYFPRPYEGYLLKCLSAGFFPLYPMRHGIRSVQMWRDPDAILKSWEACKTIGKPVDWLPDGYVSRATACSELMQNRKDVISHTDIQYEDILEDPLGAFEYLRDAGWPLVPEKAAACIDQSKRRFTTGKTVMELVTDGAA